MSDLDAIVVGAGHNGLTTAAYPVLQAAVQVSLHIRAKGVSATGFGRKVFIRRRTLGCRAMYVVASERLRTYMAATSSRTPTHLARGKIRNGSILYGSTRVISGGPTQIQTLAYRLTHGNHT